MPPAAARDGGFLQQGLLERVGEAGERLLLSEPGDVVDVGVEPPSRSPVAAMVQNSTRFGRPFTGQPMTPAKAPSTASQPVSS